MLGHLEDSSRKEFFNHLSNQAPWKDHPALNSNDVSFERLVPFAFHFDGAAFYKDDEMFVYSISSLFGNMGCCKDVLLVKIPVAIITANERP